MDSSDVLTGQVLPSYPPCAKHRETSHDAAGTAEQKWCNRCGWNREQGIQHGRPNGGWA